MACTPSVKPKYTCGEVCSRRLDCGNHECEAVCHDRDCKPCPLTVEKVTKCPCGQTDLQKLYDADADLKRRETCLDAIPTCGKVCNLTQENCGHKCESACHVGPCPPCPLTTDVRCRCGFMDRELACAQLKSRRDDARCEKRCSKKRQCGRHKCGEMCCIDLDHACPLVCGRLLGCGLHRCDDPCHRGNCQQCHRVSFDELSCRCGEQVLFPPIACGTRPPECANRCTRAHDCAHDVMHNCHAEERCPPCTALTEKRCYGGHELRKSVACHIEGLSCGRPCNRALACGRHNCIKPCHEGSCFDNGGGGEAEDRTSCGQPCKEKRELCEHPCNAPCHSPPCPTNLACKEKIKVTCECGHLTTTKTCSEQSSDYQRLQVGR